MLAVRSFLTGYEPIHKTIRRRKEGMKVTTEKEREKVRSNNAEAGEREANFDAKWLEHDKQLVISTHSHERV
jgi:hypothetical protein